MHVGQHPLQPLKFTNRATELFSLLRIFQGQFISSGSNPQCHGTCTDTLTVVGIHQSGKPSLQTFRRNQNHLFRNFQIFTNNLCFRNAAQTHCRFACSYFQTICTTQCDESGNALRFLIFKNTGKNQMKLGNSTSSNPVLCAVENIVVTFMIGTSAHF